MSFLSPLFLVGALAAALPVVLHLLRREPEVRVRFAAVHLLQHAPVERADRRRLRELLLLALRIAALVLLAVGFARPFFAGDAAGRSGGVTIVALDRSLSLTAPGQFERAKELARDAIGRATSADLVGVVTFADTAEASAAPSADRAVPIAAIEAATPGPGGTSYRAALAAASAALDGRRGTIVVVTDLQESGWDAGDRVSLPESARIEIVDVGAPPPNLALTAVRPSAGRLVAAVRNVGPQAREVRLQVRVDGRMAGEASATVGPGESTEVALPGARGGEAIISLDDPGGIQADNVRYLLLETAGRPGVLVVTTTGDAAREGFFLQHAIAASGPAGPVYQPAVVGGAQLAGWTRARLDAQSAVILLSTRTLDRRGRELLRAYVADGGGLLVAAGADIDGEVVADVLGSGISIASLTPPDGRQVRSGLSLAPVDSRHPVLAPFRGGGSLGLVRFDRVRTLRGSSCQTLARFTSGDVALAECPVGSGRALVLASDLDNAWNDFPRHASYVPFVQEAVEYLAGDAPRAADYLVAGVPAGVPPVPGFATVTERPGTTRRIAVNVDPAESNPGRLSPEEFLTAVTRLQAVARTGEPLRARQAEERQRIWQYVLGVMLAVMAFESVVARRA